MTELETSSNLGAYFFNRFAPENAEEHREFFINAFAQIEKSLDLGNTLCEIEGDLPLIENLIISEEQARAGKLAPIIKGDNFIQLYRLWDSEQNLLKNLLNKAQKIYPEISLDSDLGLNEEQIKAVKKALTRDLCLITGGPGTGKTYTLARLVAILLKNNPNLNIALAAPTGKAANRMEEALREAWSNLPPEFQIYKPASEAKTLHRLLAYGFGSFKHNESNPLPYDLIIVDEASMLSAELASALLKAALNSRLIMLGDPKQLAAVEPGAVLYDLVKNPKFQDNIAQLKVANRFTEDSEIFKLSNSLEQGFEAVKKVLKAGKEVKHLLPTKENLEKLDKFFVPYFRAVKKLSENPSAEELKNLFELFDEFRILCANKNGNLGTIFINDYLFKKFSPAQNTAEFFNGLPLMVSKNDAENGIYNGDIGIFFNGKIYFPKFEAGIERYKINPENLSPSFAMTVHKSQGSEFKKVLLIMDALREEILTTELLYTAITRAKKQLTICAHDKALKLCCEKKILRSTGINS